MAKHTQIEKRRTLTMPVTITRPVSIDSYSVVIPARPTEDLLATISCYGENGTVVNCQFYRNGSDLPANRKSPSGNMHVFSYHWFHLAKLLDLLRNEKPAFYSVRIDPESGEIYGHIGTGTEPVGEGEDQP
jgi:hypothetical protein